MITDISIIFEETYRVRRSENVGKNKNLEQESTKYWSIIASGFFEFNQAQNDVDQMREVSLETIRKFFAQWIHPDAKTIKKLSVYIRSQKLPSQENGDEFLAVVHGRKKVVAAVEEEAEGKGEEQKPVRLREGTVLVKDEAEFRSSLELSRAPIPVVDLLRYSKL